jgi:hypothetical protein
MQPSTAVAELDDHAEAGLLRRMRSDKRRRVEEGRVVSFLALDGDRSGWREGRSSSSAGRQAMDVSSEVVQRKSAASRKAGHTFRYLVRSLVAG